MSLPHLARPGHALLRCPLCRHDLMASGRTLTCLNRHCFDIARSGYVNLLDGRRRLPAAGGDSADQLRHRVAFLDAGHFDAIGAMIARHVRGAASLPENHWRVLDAGSGTGHHLARVCAGLNAPVVGLGLDISSQAASLAARRWPDLAFAVADVWRPWPVRDAASDILISVLAPKNFAEAARVLRPGGWLAMAYPGPDHLIELRQHFDLLRHHAAKTQRYADAAANLIGPPTTIRFTRRAQLDATSVRAAILMGPNASRAPAEVLEVGPLQVTFDVFILFARKLDSSR